MAVAKSPVFIIADRPVFQTAIAISSVIAASSFLITSTRIGSKLRVMTSSFITLLLQLRRGEFSHMKDFFLSHWPNISLSERQYSTGPAFSSHKLNFEG